MKIYENLKRLYPISKTLRFELRPIGKTAENVKNDILSDQILVESYKNLKPLIDGVHKDYIDKILSNFKFEFLNNYYGATLEKVDKKELEILEKTLISELIKAFSGKTSDDKKLFETLFSKELLGILKQKYPSEKIEIIEKFNNYFTYLKGFNENRKNIYGSEKGSVAYRLICENLPSFINNIKTYNILKEKNNEIINKVSKNFNITNLNEIFTIDNFNNTLRQSDVDNYNLLINGNSTESKKIQGLNEYVNLYNQKQTSKSEKIPKFISLYKQILSDKETKSFVLDIINDDKELFDSIELYYKDFKNILDKEKNIFTLINNLSAFNLEKIYITAGGTIPDLSQKMFKDYSVINQALNKWFSEHIKPITNKNYVKDLKNFFKDQISVSDINEALIEFDYEDSKTNIIEYLSTLFTGEENVLERIKVNYNQFLTIKDVNNIKANTKIIEIIKNFLDSLKDLQDILKTFVPKDRYLEKDELFYNEFLEEYNKLVTIIPLYNKVRNYISKKPYSVEKIKLNFGKSTLFDGWDLNKERDNLGVILEKNNQYYLGIINKENTKIFIDYPSDPKDYYNKMEYKLLPGPNKMLPKVFFSKSRIDEFKPSEELLKNYKLDKHKKGKDFDIKFCHELIDFFKKSLNEHKEWNQFNFEFSKTTQYKDISEFYREVEKQGYKISFNNISDKYINQLVEEGKLYLFQLYNKDFSENSKGKPNLHTIYWKALFDIDNIKNPVYKLNGEAEIFYREHSIPLKVTHEKNKPINNKNINNKNKTSTFNYDLIKDKRFTEDKFLFHVPITINFDNIGENNINNRINENLKNNDDNFVIGIDRGERHLLYLVLVNSNGKIIEQFSLNEIENEYNENKYTTNYHELLTKKSDDKLNAKKSWQNIENIKELKEGYISQVINKIVNLALKYNALIVMENLNFGFKNSRIKFEKQVYQKFEKALIEKLNFVVKKDKAKYDLGGYLNGYQLTNKIETLDKIGKQTGIVLYIPAWNTSKIDPTTGFVNLIYGPHYINIEKSKEMFAKFDDIRFNSKENNYEFVTDFKNFNPKYHDTNTKWTICSYGERIKTFPNSEKNNHMDSRELILTDEFNNLFKKYNLNINNLKQEIINQNSAEFFKDLISLLKLMLQTRNSITGKDTDYMISPVKNRDGYFFDSRKVEKELPENADANGAYNIARKGLMAINIIKNTPSDKKPDLNITNEDWLRYCQGE